MQRRRTPTRPMPKAAKQAAATSKSATVTTTKRASKKPTAAAARKKKPSPAATKTPKKTIAAARRKTPKTKTKTKTTSTRGTTTTTTTTTTLPRATPRIPRLPILWRFNTGSQTVGLWVDDLVWVSNDAANVYALGRDGALVKEMKLPEGSASIIADEAWKYAGCEDGRVYDITGRVPRAMYDIGKANIGWIEVYRGNLCVSDLAGTVAVFDVDGEQRWKRKVKDGGEGWVLRVDGTGLYHGCEIGLRKLSWGGEVLWHNHGVDDVRFAVDHGDALAVTGGYENQGDTTLYVVDKATGKTRQSVLIESDGPGFSSNGAEAAAVGRAADGSTRLYVACGNYLFGFDEALTVLWEAKIEAGPICNMQLVDETLYYATYEGAVCALDVGAQAIHRALAGTVKKPRVRQAPRQQQRDDRVEVVTLASAEAAGQGVVVEVVKVGGKLKVRPVGRLPATRKGKALRKDWFCQFPRDLREEGARFVVDELREAAQGGFYRPFGDIRRLLS